MVHGQSKVIKSYSSLSGSRIRFNRRFERFNLWKATAKFRCVKSAGSKSKLSKSVPLIFLSIRFPPLIKPFVLD